VLEIYNSMNKYYFSLIFGIFFGAAITFINWLLALPVIHAPYNLRAIIVLVHMAPIYLSDILSGNSHENGNGRMLLFWLLVFVQWFVIGLTFAFLYRCCGFSGHRKKTDI